MKEPCRISTVFKSTLLSLALLLFSFTAPTGDPADANGDSVTDYQVLTNSGL